MAKKTKYYKNGSASAVGRRRRKRSGDYSLYIIFSAAIVLLIAFVISVTLLFNVRDFDISGDAPYTAEQVIAASGIKIGDSLISLDVSEVSDNITKKLPFVDTVEIKRLLPRTVKITHTRAVPFLYVVLGGEVHALSKNLKILETITTAELAKRIADGGVVTVTGAADFEKDTAAENPSLLVAKEIAEFADAEGLKLSGTIDVSSLIDIRVLYAHRVSIRFGTRSELSEKVKVAATMLKDYIGGDETGILRVQNPQRFSFEPVAAAEIDGTVTAVSEETETGEEASEELSADPSGIAAGSVPVTAAAAVPEQTEAAEQAEQTEESDESEEPAESAELDETDEAETDEEVFAEETLPEPAKPSQDIYIAVPEDDTEPPELT